MTTANTKMLVERKDKSRFFRALGEHFFGTAATPFNNPVPEGKEDVETHIRPWKHSTLQEGADVDDTKNHQFAVSKTDCPHKKRKRDILRAHPEIASLAGYEPATKYLALALVGLQLYIANAMASGVVTNWALRVLIVYFVGGIANHCCAMIIHEASHNLTASTGLKNRAVGFLANIAMAVPSAASFRRYHLEHHAYQGVRDGDTQDADLPADFELPLVKNKTIRKIVWLYVYAIGYAARAMLLGNTPSTWELYNLAFTFAVNSLIVVTMGWTALGYLFFSSMIGLGLHPVAGHFIQEHFTFVDGQETYSCYGPLNIFALNVGYHNEHHDFADIPWSRLSLINKAAPEFYNSLAYHTSWSNCLYRFITDERMGAYSRLIRTFDDHRKGRREVNDGKGKN